MKLGKLRTLRGQIEVTGGGVAKANLVTADGLVNYGLKILSFTVWNNQTPSGFSAQQLTGILSLDTIGSGDNMNAGDNRQFAWYQSSVSSTLGNIIQPYGIIDPDHIVNRDLYLTLDNTSTGVYNYLIEAQVVELTDDEAIITIIKENSQS
jgi:hypothetical protein